MSQTDLAARKDRPVETVRMWRPDGPQGVLLMRGRTASYSVDSSDGYFIGVIDAHSMRVTRGRSRYLVRPGELVVWDPSHPHSGVPAERQPWLGTLMVVELPDLRNAGEDGLLPDLEFPQPVIRDPRMVADFRDLHRAMAALGTVEATELLIDRLRHTKTNKEFLNVVDKTLKDKELD